MANRAPGRSRGTRRASVASSRSGSGFPPRRINQGTAMRRATSGPEVRAAASLFFREGLGRFHGLGGVQGPAGSFRVCGSP
jgi:hypothetical protein